VNEDCCYLETRENPTCARKKMSMILRVLTAAIYCLAANVALGATPPNIIVMFLSDNGGCSEEPGGRDDTQQPGLVSTYTAVGPAWGWAQNTPFRHYKSWPNEGGISTPLIVRWPGKVLAGTITKEVGHIIDVLPTCLEVAGASYPKEFNGKRTQTLEGESLLPILQGGKRVGHESIFWEWSGNCAVRQGNWKLVWDTLSKAKK